MPTKSGHAIAREALSSTLSMQNAAPTKALRHEESALESSTRDALTHGRSLLADDYAWPFYTTKKSFSVRARPVLTVANWTAAIPPLPSLSYSRVPVVEL